jgi:transporter family-2 protein
VSKSVLISLALIGGAVLPLQALVNARLGAALVNPYWATTVSFVIGTLGLLLYIVLLRQPLPSMSHALSYPWWVWLGGLLGAFYVAVTIITVPALGATALVILIILGQLVAGALLDHFGVLTERRPITLERALGIVLVLLGTFLAIRRIR